MTFQQARWRLQLIAELTVGTAVRATAQAESDQMQRMKGAFSRGSV